jgi:hypothetical protein
MKEDQFSIFGNDGACNLESSAEGYQDSEYDREERLAIMLENGASKLEIARAFYGKHVYPCSTKGCGGWYIDSKESIKDWERETGKKYSLKGAFAGPYHERDKFCQRCQIHLGIDELSEARRQSVKREEERLQIEQQRRREGKP